MDKDLSGGIRMPLYFKGKKNPFEAAIEIVANNDATDVPHIDESKRKELRRQRGLYGTLRKVKLKSRSSNTFSSLDKLQEIADTNITSVFEKISKSNAIDAESLKVFDQIVTEPNLMLIEANKITCAHFAINLKDVEFYALCNSFECINNEDCTNLNMVSINCRKFLTSLKIECNRIHADNQRILKNENDKKEFDRLGRDKMKAKSMINANYNEVDYNVASRRETLAVALEKIFKASRLKWKSSHKEFQQLVHSNLTSSLNVFQLKDFLRFHFFIYDVHFSTDESYALLKYWVRKNDNYNDVASNILDFKIENILEREMDIVDNIMTFDEIDRNDENHTSTGAALFSNSSMHHHHHHHHQSIHSLHPSVSDDSSVHSGIHSSSSSHSIGSHSAGHHKDLQSNNSNASKKIDARISMYHRYVPGKHKQPKELPPVLSQVPISSSSAASANVSASTSSLPLHVLYPNLYPQQTLGKSNHNHHHQQQQQQQQQQHHLQEQQVHYNENSDNRHGSYSIPVHLQQQHIRQHNNSHNHIDNSDNRSGRQSIPPQFNHNHHQHHHQHQHQQQEQELEERVPASFVAAQVKLFGLWKQK